MIKSEEEWNEEYFNDECTCALVDLEMDNGDSFQFGVAVTKDADACWGDGVFEHNAGSYIFQQYSDWYSIGKKYIVERVSHSEFLKLVNRKAHQVGGSVGADGGVYIISSNNKSKRAEADLQDALDKYELDHEDDY